MDIHARTFTVNSPIPWLAWPETKALIHAFTEAGIDIRFDGGCVRDALLNRRPHDIDMVVAASLDTIHAQLKKHDIAFQVLDPLSGLIAVDIDKRFYDIVSLYQRLTADKIPTASLSLEEQWQQDAKLRDFTLNAMYLTPDGQLIDYFHGAEDLKEGRIRFIKDPEASMKEDGDRILRFFRMQALYGKQEPDSALLALIRKHIHSVADAPAEFIQKEMQKFLRAPKPYAMLKSLIDYKILPYVFGFGIIDCEPIRNLEIIEEQMKRKAIPGIRLMGLMMRAELPPEQALDNIMQRWNFNAQGRLEMQRIAQALVRIDPSTPLSELKQLRQEMGESFDGTIMLRWALEDDTAAAETIYLPMLAQKI
jgi:tRNA nucleotidyltransferase/poly(A) polymerase